MGEFFSKSGCVIRHYALVKICLAFFVFIQRIYGIRQNFTNSFGNIYRVFAEFLPALAGNSLNIRQKLVIFTVEIQAIFPIPENIIKETQGAKEIFEQSPGKAIFGVLFRYVKKHNLCIIDI